MLAPEFVPNWGGVGTYILELIRHLPEEFEITLVTPDRRQKGISQEDQSDIHPRLEVIYTKKVKDTFIYNIAFQMSCYREVKRLKKDVDLFHSHTAHMPDLFVSYDKEATEKTITTVHSTIGLQRHGSRMTPSFSGKEFSEKMTTILYPALALSERLYFKGKRRYLTVSNWMKQHLEQVYKLSEVEVVYNAVDVDVFRKTPEVEKGIMGKEVIFFCGRLIGLKGIHTLIDAMTGILSERKELIFAFAGGGNEDLFKGLMRSKGISPDNFLFLGHLSRSEIIKYYNLSSMLVLPSYHENMPLTVLEAMSCELPCIATSVGGVPEVIEDGVDGFLVPPRDPEALKNAILRALELEQDLKKVGKRARKKIEKGFSWADKIGEILELYRDFS